MYSVHRLERTTFRSVVKYSCFESIRLLFPPAVEGRNESGNAVTLLHFPSRKLMKREFLTSRPKMRKRHRKLLFPCEDKINTPAVEEEADENRVYAFTHQ
ncbi:hypothetical protein CRM22_008885 [Opisthorchis felineus]|uniref:Uncharacterized protein n=1 Tax=Opisthorchis felineus TaxID=147828 RepID=A0A4S2L944_OPIFE|nr:hypothetical protein CRM22_008885 [Opisthorchis felineus]